MFLLQTSLSNSHIACLMQKAFMVGGKVFVLVTVQIDIHFEKNVPNGAHQRIVCVPAYLHCMNFSSSFDILCQSY